MGVEKEKKRVIWAWAACWARVLHTVVNSDQTGCIIWLHTFSHGEGYKWCTSPPILELVKSFFC